MRKSRQTAALDKQIEAIYYRAAAGKQINILDIGKVFKAGHAAAAAGADVEAAIVAAVATYCTSAR